MQRLLWVGDSPTQPTGFGRVTGEVLARLQKDFQVCLLGLNYDGDPHPLPYLIFPAANIRYASDLHGFKRLPILIEQLQPDIVILFNDLDVIAEYWRRIKTLRRDGKFKVFAYFPVDSVGLSPKLWGFLNEIDGAATYTHFGVNVLHDAGYTGELAVIPHAADQNIFKPLDKLVCRKKFDLPENAFIVLNANRNQPRKRIDITIQGFIRLLSLVKEEENINPILWLHMGLKDAGWDIKDLFNQMCQANDIDPKNRLIVSTSEKSHPEFPVETLNQIYNCADVMVNTSIGEGWGLVAHEGALAGIPQIVPNNTASSELFGDGRGLLIDCLDEWVNPALNNTFFVPDAIDLERLLRRVALDKHEGISLPYAQNARDFFSKITWDNVADKFKLLINQGHNKMLTFRTNTFDEAIWNSITYHNEYKLPNLMKNAVVIDVGVHIGAFSYACLRRGSKIVYGYEAHPENLEIAIMNLEHYRDRINLKNLAVWRSDVPTSTLTHTGFTFDDPTQLVNTGGGNVWSGNGDIKVNTIPLQEVINSCVEKHGKVDVLKLDCEGSEFISLMTTDLSNVVNIVGEFHEFQGDYDNNPIPDYMKLEGYERFTIVELSEYLTNQGFTVDYERSLDSEGKPCSLGQFSAYKPQ